MISLTKKIRLFLAKVRYDRISAYSGHAALFILMSLFPFLMLLMTLAGFFPLWIQEIERAINALSPTTIGVFLSEVVSEAKSMTAGAVIPITAATTLWAASKGMIAVVRGLNSVNDTKEARNYFHLRAISLVYTLAFVAILGVTFVIIIFGNSIFSYMASLIPSLQGRRFIVTVARMFGALLILFVFFVVAYKVVPNKKIKIVSQLPGAFFSACGWIAFSYLYSIYIDRFSTSANIYGSLTAIVLVMFWLYCCLYIMLLGAEINSFLILSKNMGKSGDTNDEQNK